MAIQSRVIQGGSTSMTQPYHINGQKGYNYDHWGVDLTGFNGSYNTLAYITAHSAGTVVDIRTNCTGFENNSYGNYVLLKHSNGMYTMYAHLAYGYTKVSYGQTVTQGQVLGYMGNTGTSYGGHLHFEVRQSNGYKIDPEPYLNKNLPNISDLTWKKYNGSWYLYKGTSMLTGWQKEGGKWYYLDPSSGIMKTGWLYDKKYKGWFLFGSNGEMLIGWQKANNKWYYLSPETNKNFVKGIMRKGWQNINNKWYYLQEKQDADYKEGEMRIGWLYDTKYKGWFLLGSDGAMLTGWQKVKDKWYYLAPKSENKIVKGIMRAGWLKINGKTYYLDAKKGHMLTGTQTINKKKYTFDNDGALVQ